MAKRPALGRGIGALLDSAAREGGRKYFHCPIEELRPHKEQPRKSFDQGKMTDLVASIREKGIIQPLVVRRVDDHYQIIAGERRWRAAQKAGLLEIPVVIQDVSEDWAFELALIENIQREDLNPIEEAEAFSRLIGEFDLSQEEVAKRVGKDRSTIANALRLLKLPAPIRQDVLDQRLTMGHARALLPLEDEKKIMQVRNQVVSRRLSVRACEELVKKTKTAAKRVPGTDARPDPELAHLSRKMQQVLGTQVTILPKKQGGKIEISYYSAQDLDRLLELLGIA